MVRTYRYGVIHSNRYIILAFIPDNLKYGIPDKIFYIGPIVK
jgi:hypothetical protein